MATAEKTYSHTLNERSPGAKSRTCHICNSSCVISGYVGHVNLCKKKFLAEQALLPLHERRRLPPDPLFNGNKPSVAELEILSGYSKSTSESGVCVHCGLSLKLSQLNAHQQQCSNPSRGMPSRPISAPPVRSNLNTTHTSGNNSQKVDSESIDELSKTAPVPSSKTAPPVLRTKSFVGSIKDSLKASMGRNLKTRKGSVAPSDIINETDLKLKREEDGIEAHKRKTLKERSARIDAITLGVQGTLEGLEEMQSSLNNGRREVEEDRQTVRESSSSLTDLRMKLHSRGGTRSSSSSSPLPPTQNQSPHTQIMHIDSSTWRSQDTLRNLEARTATIETALLGLLKEVREVRSIIATDLVQSPPADNTRSTQGPLTPLKSKYKQAIRDNTSAASSS